ncbi:xanthine dehydrogenase family protein molybdopterin-binding subunit [Mucilaginibacter pallidiroseus]|uniref:Xanthine dehydrogenase family protein molybdopterin-binding subunit n=1 Tax=Mucilaginibacter pallidiroseus TaxID=2599295 RepID=A0A563U817_9SPHI|nr:molybdopterin cofactor-binding domain-containing protein [Mucilaginibacter pallidiroseus]TWR27521.1 xanthine dehydrogenase family protein molybdopterin-binding subunit [Mucilaginibacter pallidiroseus]
MEANAISRRNFLKISGLAGSALCLGTYFVAEAKNENLITAANAEKAGIEMNAWIHIDTNGKVTIVDHRAEMGQGSYQSVPQIVAEELEVDLKDIDVIFGEGNQEKFGNQITGGSSTIRGSYKNLLKLGATSRVLLVTAAANKWGVPLIDCYAKSGHVFHRPTGKKFHYGELVEVASKLTPPQDIPLKTRAEYKLIGKPLNRRDSPAKTNGEAIFGLDKKLPGMLYAAVERNPRMRGKVKSFDATEALKVPGVKKVFKVKMGVFTIYREGVAVVATSTWAALQGKKALKVTWDDTGFEHINTADIYKIQHEKLKTDEGLLLQKVGNPDAAISKAAKVIDVVYQTPYQSHSAMEPVNCVAWYRPEKLEIWGPIQAPEWVQDFVSKQMKMPKKNVIVNMTFLGGGFGRKAFMDYPHEAAVISKEAGAPVQVIWKREDDLTQGPYRPGITYRCQGVIDNGEMSVAKFRMAGQNIDHWSNGKSSGKANDSTSEGFLKPYFDSIKNVSFAEVVFEAPIPAMWWRSVYASTNGFAYESFLNEMAHEANKDQLDFRRAYLKDERCQQLIDKLEKVSGWKSRDKKSGYGVAITECFNTTVGQVVKVSRQQNGKIKIDKVWAVMDCGWYVNPDIIAAQVEGSVLMGLGAATTHEITFKDGLVQQNNFYDYPMPRIADMPPVEVHIMENTADAGGVGEPGLPPFAPALTDAIFDLTGKRIRKLPFDMQTV